MVALNACSMHTADIFFDQYIVLQNIPSFSPAGEIQAICDQILFMLYSLIDVSHFTTKSYHPLSNRHSENTSEISVN